MHMQSRRKYVRIVVALAPHVLAPYRGPCHINNFADDIDQNGLWRTTSSWVDVGETRSAFPPKHDDRQT